MLRRELSDETCRRGLQWSARAGRQPRKGPAGRQVGRFTSPLAAALIAACCASAAAANGLVIRPQAAVVRIAAPPAPRPVEGFQLVNTDEELVGFLAEAERLAKQGDYERAIEILQALLMRGDSGFVPAERGVYVGLSVKADETLAGMGDEGLRLYRRLHDGQAAALFEKARRTGLIGPLQRLIQQYRHSSFGAQALDRLGGIYFDRGRFVQAAYCWKQALRLQSQRTPRPLLLAKLAAASHLAGDSLEARKILETLSKEFPDAREVVAGRPRNLAEFVAGVLKIPVAAAGDREVLESWPGLGGVPTGLAVMPDCEFVLMPRWVQRAEGDSGHAVRLAASAPLKQMTFAARTRYGHVEAELFLNERRSTLSLPGTIHPVVVGDSVIYRTDENVVACDLSTGRRLWEAGGLPVLRDVPGTETYRAYQHRYLAQRPDGAVGDGGLYMLTAADGKIFVRHGFLPPFAAILRTIGAGALRAGLAEQLSDTSELAAIDAPSGRLLWRVGNGAGDDEVIRGGNFVSPPTCHAGRLYAVVLYVYRYYVVCLDADTGGTIWRSRICQGPSPSYGSMRGYGWARVSSEWCSPPAVSDGRVFVLPNVGVLVAVDAETGLPLWANHYDSILAGAGGNRSRAVAADLESVNPIVISGRRVICLPSDGRSLIAVRADDGSALWSVARDGCSDLSAIDAHRVLLSGPNLVVLSVDGQELSRPVSAAGICGRPAVTENAVFASGRGKVYRLDLQSYELKDLDMADADCILGNLVSTGGALIAANPMGLSAYFPFEVVRAGLDEQISRAETQARAKLLFRRARLAFNAEAIDQALDDLLAARRLFRQSGDTAMLEHLRTWIYRAYVALGNRSPDAEKMRDSFEKALAIAATPQELAHMKLRLVKVSEKAGRLAEAVALAQEISESYPQEEIVDVQIGSRTEGLSRLGEGLQWRPAGELAQGFISRLLGAHGRGPYKRFDKLASEALAQAEAAGDPKAMVAVYERWPSAGCAGQAMYAAAEACVRAAASAPKAEAKKLLRDARNHLFVVTAMRDSPLRLPASAVMAVLAARDGKTVTAADWCGRARRADDFDAAGRVDFADIHGTIAQVISKVEQSSGSQALDRRRQESFVNLPLAESFTIADGAVVLLRDQEYRPVRLGERVLALRGDRAILVDTAAADASSAVTWSALAPVDAGEMAFVLGSHPGWLVTVGLSEDESTIVIAGRTEARGYDARTAKVRWRREMSALGLGECQFMSTGEGVMVALDSSGALACVDLASGALRWRGSIRGPDSQPSGPATIGAGVALVSQASGRKLTCFDLSNGKVLKVWDGPGRGLISGWVVPTGFLAVMADGDLTVQEIQNIPGAGRRITEPIWRRSFADDSSAKVLCVSEDYIAVSAGGPGRIEVYSLVGGASPVAVLATGSIGPIAAAAIQLSFDGDSLYALCAMSVPDPATGDRQGRSHRGLSIQKFSIALKSLVWQRDLSSDAGDALIAMPITIGRDSLALTVLPGGPELGGELYLLDPATGQDKAAPMDLGAVPFDQEAGGQLDSAILAKIPTPGPAVITKGRLCFETLTGLKVYANK